MTAFAETPPRTSTAAGGEFLAGTSPILFGVGVLLSRYATVPTPPESTVRSFAVVIGLAIASLLLLRLATGSWTWAGILSSAFVLFNLREVLLFTPLIGFAVWWPIVGLLRRRQHRPPADAAIPRRVGRAMGIVSVVYCLTMLFTATLAFASRAPDAHYPQYEGNGIAGPNVYIVLLDGYPRTDTLESEFQHDDGSFTAGLRSLGFSVASTARTNYPKTWLTLASMFNGAYVMDLLADQEVPSASSDQLRWLHSMIGRASILDPFRQSGYTITTMPTAFRSTSLLSADEVIDNGSLNDFEARLVWQSPWMVLLHDQVGEFLLSSQRSEVIGTLDSLEAVATAADGPKFVFAHVHSPHPPFVLNQELRLPACFPTRCSLWHVTTEELGVDFAEYRASFLTQLEALNGLVLESLGSVVEADPNAVVIVMSDHGARYSLGDIREHYRSFLAWRAPGHADLLADDETTVNILRDVARTYLGVDAPRLQDEFWLADWENNLDLRRSDEMGE